MLYKKIISDKTLVWNGISNLLFGFQSVMLLVVLTRTVGIDESGIFTIAYANASLFLLVGKYGVRNYHVSDVRTQHTFGDYRLTRIITIVIMVVAFGISLIYSARTNNYSMHKSMIMVLLCLYKVPDAIEDVYYGEFQRQGRLAIAAKIMSYRLMISIISLAVSIIISRNLAISLLVSIVLSFLSMYIMIFLVKSDFRLDGYKGLASVREILIGCFPLFAGTFFSQYLSNAPKYAIDAHLTSEIQACYGFISMPVFVINLLNNIIFSPVIHKMSKLWQNGNKRDFGKRFIEQIKIIGVITVVIIIGACFIGIPVLSILYSTDLTEYKREFIILLSGGFFLAISELLNIMLTIMRKQFILLIGYVFVTIIAWFFCNRMVMNLGVLGAALIYTGLMAFLALFFMVVFVCNFNVKQKQNKYKEF